ncbi:MAG: DUF423 domain-containing protein [candidate division KSB1 bacterium]|nr:DUF423 domain-containing protein [candidate division KSB1 bacterium]
MAKTWLMLGALFGGLAVALGAFGAHALKNSLNAYALEIYNKAVLYQMWHALALLAVGLLQQWQPPLNVNPSGWLFTAGIVLFSGSLYILALTGATVLGMITPFGGVAFIAGWLWLLLKVWKG